jgi:hypothetical protein
MPQNAAISRAAFERFPFYGQDEHLTQESSELADIAKYEGASEATLSVQGEQS